VRDQVAQTPDTEAVTERLDPVADDGRVGAGAHGRRTRQVKQHAELAKVVSRPGDFHQFLTATG
jgi:hypothetical protein